MDLIQHGKYNKEHDVDLLRQPLRISEKKLISCSIIDHDHRATFGEAGFILTAPFENVLAMTPTDGGTNYRNPAGTLASLSSNKKHMCIDRLLDATSSTEWNEVTITGQTEAGKVKIIGAFIKTDQSGQEIDPYLADQVKSIAKTIGIPVFEILQPLHKHLDHDIEILTTVKTGGSLVPYAFAFNRNGTRYLIELKNEKSENGIATFYTVDEVFKLHPMTAREAQFALDVICKELSEKDRNRFSSLLERLNNQKPVDLPPDVTTENSSTLTF